jgi:hypothetical protein
MLNDNHNGDGEFSEQDIKYGLLIEDLQKQGIVADGNKMAQEGAIPPWLPSTNRYRNNASLLATVPNSEDIYTKQDKIKGVLLDLLARTNFRNEKQHRYLEDWISWCDTYTHNFDRCIREIVGLNSIGGRGRQDLVESITTTRLHQYGNSNKPRNSNKYQDGRLS